MTGLRWLLEDREEEGKGLTSMGCTENWGPQKELNGSDISQHDCPHLPRAMVLDFEREKIF
ncbi:hypothetical protein L484_012898 [Morus notabilis]|uniref:Uncharacterized protein n=1 Tax=Morus notabilis TaxID=981085 RepID=W9RR08_9ROSA|nr:hypothetical protein L484_012898 [Morus notabilis]